MFEIKKYFGSKFYLFVNIFLLLVLSLFLSLKFVYLPVEVDVMSSESTKFQIFYLTNGLKEDSFSEEKSVVFNVNSLINKVDNQMSEYEYSGRFKFNLPITTSNIRLDISESPHVKFFVTSLNISGLNLLPLFELKYFSQMKLINGGGYESTGSDPSIIYLTEKIFAGFIAISTALFLLIFSGIELVVYLSYKKLSNCTHSRSSWNLFQIFILCLSGVTVFLLFVYAFVWEMYGDVPLYQILFHARLENFQSFSTPGQSSSVLFYFILFLILEVLLFASYAFFNSKFTGTYFSILIVFCLSSAYFLNNRLAIADYFLKPQSSFITKNYAIPLIQNNHQVTNDSRNLILIFMESMEWTYAESSVFGVNLLQELSFLAHEGLVFEGHIKTPGAMFTADGLASQLCGLPLVHLGFDIHQSNSKYDVLLRRAPSIFNVLKSYGYRTAAIFGSSGRFTQIGNFFKFHGIDEVYDKDYYLKQGYSLTENKGFGDDYRDEFVYQRLKDWLKIYGNQGKFAVTMQTIDTHFPKGYAPKESVKFNDHRDSIRNASRLAFDFINWAKQQSWYSNTTIVIVGDHPWLDGPNAFTQDYIRRSHVRRQLFNLILNPSIPPKSGRISVPGGYTSMDMAPTILDALGVSYNSKDFSGVIVHNKFGLGVSLYSSTPTIISIFGKDEVINQLNQRDSFYESLF